MYKWNMPCLLLSVLFQHISIECSLLYQPVNAWVNKPWTVIMFPQDMEHHMAFIMTVPTTLAIFLAIFILVCIESVFKKLLRLFSLLIWGCLVAMGYLFMFFGGIICPWDQVRLEWQHFHSSPFQCNCSSVSAFDLYGYHFLIYFLSYWSTQN